MLPRSGVYYLPDDRVMAYLKLVNQMRKKYELDQNYIMANELREIFTKTGKDEQHRQVHNMRVAQDREIQSIEEAQKI